jgi:hypothetical protein
VQEEALKAFAAAVLDAESRRFHRAGIRPRLRKPLGTDRAVASPRARISQAQCYPRKLNEDKQKEFIEDYDKILNSLGNDEVVLFADEVHPNHAARPVGCWAPN